MSWIISAMCRRSRRNSPSVASYYPETNKLMPISHCDRLSKTPSAKSIPVIVRPMTRPLTSSTRAVVCRRGNGSSCGAKTQLQFLPHWTLDPRPQPHRADLRQMLRKATARSGELISAGLAAAPTEGHIGRSGRSSTRGKRKLTAVATIFTGTRAS